MTPSAARDGQLNVLRTHYTRAGDQAVAFIDETYHVEADGRQRFYVMAAVIIVADDRDALRQEIDGLVPDGWWHTTEALRTDDGRDQARDLLRQFRIPDETCVIVETSSVDDGDTDGTKARMVVLGRLLTAVYGAETGAPPVNLAVIEQHREARLNSFDRTVRANLIAAGTIAETTALLAVSPGSEHLLWLPDLVCSAYRQKTVFNREDLFSQIEELTHVIHAP